MKNILYIIVIIFFTFTIYSCAKKDTTSSDTTTELEGTWITSCYATGLNSDHMIQTVTISGTVSEELYNTEPPDVT